ncbi:hypothetical protein [Tenuibacillus multivorans]|uniref:Uncharacterized protein n=1 Tax=Tenuibacillus multivorans TaxID=237069 RepID=A0A1G9YJY6_9BACI|nr:hypothetical protein [Tenuibacillus multivorans]GEL78496.1 hypothetical protein TMU01_27310 [Tenuibacillus multivorans]SDN08785.1 hypothetical protein SAMN05216498_1416 [Tenuibacillus multivorans]
MKYTILILLIGTALLAGCQSNISNATESYIENYEIIGEEKEGMLEDVSETIFETTDRSNAQAEEILEYYPEEDIEELTINPGRYQITGDGSGNVYIYDQQGDLLFHDILGGRNGVESITIDIAEQHTIKIDGLFHINFTPVPTEIKTDLTAGIWEVGTDVAAGTYDVTTPHGIGYVQIFDPDGDHQVYEFIANELSQTKSTIKLTEGQMVRVTDISLVKLKPSE